MADAIIENPVINSPYREPDRHFRFDEDGITSEIVERRRKSSYFTPIPQPKKRKMQNKGLFDEEWTKEREEENEFINQIRSRVTLWRKQGYPYTTRITRGLLDYWTNTEREKPLFFCQIEALETAIYIAEVANKDGQSWIANRLQEASDEANPGVFRVALKMATGTGKTVVMAMLIAWQALNKVANPQDKRFTDSFLIVTPGITIRDRLRVLLPNDPDNYYVKRDVLNSTWLQQLQQAKIVITNFHAFQLREKVEASALAKKILTGDSTKSPFLETPDQMVNRVCREFGNKRGIIVINDEAHHCYRQKVDNEGVKLSKSEQTAAEEGRVWISGIEAIANKIGVKTVYDLSATPFFLRGSGYREGTLFPWVVSDFSLIDAIESGIVKIPRVPVADDAMTGDMPTYRNLWVRIREDLPKRKKKSLPKEPNLPLELEGALKSLYGNYERHYRRWQADIEQYTDDPAYQTSTPPVMIVVCSNTMVSKMVFDWIAGYTRETPQGEVIVPGNLGIFRNERDGRWLPRPNTILVDSQQLESGDAMDRRFKQVAAKEIETFEEEFQQRYPERDVSQITDEDLLREVMNTVGKPGRLGEQIKCVVSVSMLTEGWDANTVTHILGVRAFSTQLICEQVVGRGLRRRSYVPDENGMFEPEYAEIYGVPFSFIPTAGSSNTPKPPKNTVRVQAQEERASARITFPRLTGYRYEVRDGKLNASFDDDSRMVISSQDVPTMTESSSIFGEGEIHELSYEDVRPLTVAFKLAKLVLEKEFRDNDGNVKHWYFPQLLQITKDWMQQCVDLRDGTDLRMLYMDAYAHQAAEHIMRAIPQTSAEEATLRPILETFEPVGKTDDVDFDTLRDVWQTNPHKCHVNYVALDSDWEAKMAQSLEEMPEVLAYVKNDGLGFFIPYATDGRDANYQPDFIAKVQTDEGVLNLVLEVTGERRKAKQAKVATARNLWIPAVNNAGVFGVWDFIEITDPWDAQRAIREALGIVPTQKLF